MHRLWPVFTDSHEYVAAFFNPGHENGRDFFCCIPWESHAYGVVHSYGFSCIAYGPYSQIVINMSPPSLIPVMEMAGIFLFIEYWESHAFGVVHSYGCSYIAFGPYSQIVMNM